MKNLEAQFHQEMVNIYRRSVDECGYQPSYFLQMVNEKKGKQTAIELITATKPSDGFTKLWELKRLDLTVEALALTPPWNELFKPDVLALARKRLKAYGYTADKS